MGLVLTFLVWLEQDFNSRPFPSCQSTESKNNDGTSEKSPIMISRENIWCCWWWGQ